MLKWDSHLVFRQWVGKRNLGPDPHDKMGTRQKAQALLLTQKSLGPQFSNELLIDAGTAGQKELWCGHCLASQFTVPVLELMLEVLPTHRPHTLGNLQDFSQSATRVRETPYRRNLPETDPVPPCCSSTSRGLPDACRNQWMNEKINEGASE